MLRKLVAGGLLSVMLAAALFSLFRLPVEAETVYREITGTEELTDGRYVLITPQGFAPGTLAEEEGVISAVSPTAAGDTVTDTDGGEWDLTVTENGVILTDAHGVPVAPMEDGGNGITAGAYEWQVSWKDGCFSFHGFSGEAPVTLVSDLLSDYAFRACMDVDIADAADFYFGGFTLYRCTEVQDDEPGQGNPGQDNPGQDNPGQDNPGQDNPGQDNPGQDNPGQDDPGQDAPGQDNPGQDNPGQDDPGQDDPKPEEPKPGEAVKTSPKVIVSPEGGEIGAGEEITLTCEGESAKIYFAVSADGVNYQPDMPYTAPICFEKGFAAAYLKAYSKAEGCEPGEVTQAVFTEKFTPDWNVYFGQLHAHTNLSDGTGSVEEAFAYASKVENLDFFAVTDHSDSFDNTDAGAIGADGRSISAGWATGKQAAASVTNEDFVGLFGFEMTWPEDKQLGHISTFNTPGWQTRDQEAFENVPTALENYYEALTAVPGSVSQFNHPDTIHGDFERFDHYSPKYDEVISLLEIAGEDGAVDCEYYHLALDKGWHVAPTNNQNNHNGQWGDASRARTVILAETLTEEALYAAMKDRRVYATQDSDLTVYYTLNGAVMGSILPKSEEAEITVFLSDPTDEAIGNVEVVADGRTVLTEQVGTPAQMLELSVSGGYSYYYLRITQPDGDVAVTAPVWMDGYDDIGIESFTSDTLTPVRDEEIKLTVELYNDEPVDFIVESLSLYADGKEVCAVSDPGTAAGMGTLSHTFSYAHREYGMTKFRVEAVGSVNGEKRAYEKTLSLSFRVPKQVKHIAVDASHGNSGTDKLNRLAEIAARNSISVKKFETELPENSDLLLITAPSKPFDEEFVEKVRIFAENGGTVILCGQSDLGDLSGLHTSGELNRLLEAMGATVRLNDDTAWDEEGGGNTPDAVSSDVFNPGGDLTKSLKPEQAYTQRAGCTVNPGSGTWLVKGRSTTRGVDADGDGQDTGENAVLLACEELANGGKVYVSGGLFLSDDGMKEPENIRKRVSGNQGIAEALLGIEPLVTIGEMRSGEDEEVFRIRGWATSGTSRPGNIFPDTIYLQDDTGGVALVPFTEKEKDIKVGTPIEAVGQKEIHGGNVVLKIIDYDKLDEPLYNYTPETTPNKTAMDYEANGGRLMQVEGKVTDVTPTNRGKGVARITLKDGNGDFAEILIEDGIVSGADGKNNLASQVKEGRTVRAIGILHLESAGTPVLRVRNCDEVVYVPPVPVSLGSRRNPRTGDLIWIAVGVMVLSGIGLAVLLNKKKR